MGLNLIRNIAVSALALGGLAAGAVAPAQAAGVPDVAPFIETVQYYAPPRYYRGPPRYYSRPYYARPYYARPYYRPLPPPYYGRPYYGRRYYR